MAVTANSALDQAPSQAADDVMCMFCLKSSADVQTIVAGPGVFICDECVSLCAEIIASKPAGTPVRPEWAAQLPDDALLASLPKMAAVSALVDRQLAIWVGKARARGITWTRIGTALGMTRQSAWERFSGEE
jgi:hypothetical protein